MRFFIAFKHKVSEEAGVFSRVTKLLTALVGRGAAFHVDIGYAIPCGSTYGKHCALCQASTRPRIHATHHIITYNVGQYGQEPGGVTKSIDRWPYNPQEWTMYVTRPVPTASAQVACAFMTEQVGKGLTQYRAWLGFLMRPATALLRSSEVTSDLRVFDDRTSWTCSEFATAVVNALFPEVRTHNSLEPYHTVPSALEKALHDHPDAFAPVKLRTDIGDACFGDGHVVGTLTRTM